MNGIGAQKKIVGDEKTRIVVGARMQSGVAWKMSSVGVRRTNVTGEMRKSDGAATMMIVGDGKKMNGAGAMTTTGVEFSNSKGNSMDAKVTRHPLEQALEIASSATERVRLLRDHSGPTHSPQHAIVLLAPQRILRRQVVVLVDWTRSKSVLPIALPAYASLLRKVQAPRIRLSKDFLWVLHYPRRLLLPDALDDTLRLLFIAMGDVGASARERWAAILEGRLVHGKAPEKIAAELGDRPSSIRAVLLEGYRAFKRLRTDFNPLDPFRLGGDLFGTFHLEWDDFAGNYCGIADEAVPSRCVPLIKELIAESGLEIGDDMHQASAPALARRPEAAESAPYSMNDFEDIVNAQADDSFNAVDVFGALDFAPFD